MAQFYAIQLILDNSYSEAESSEIAWGSRAMIYFVERRLHRLNYQSEFTKLNIYCSKSPADDALMRFKAQKKFAGVKIQMDPGQFLSSPAMFHKTCAEMIRRGVDAASKHTPLPVDEIDAAIDEFVDGGCINQWVHADKTWKKLGVRSVIHCDLRTDAFVLYQQIHHGESTQEAMIARTKPLEWLFYQVLGKLMLRDGLIEYGEKGNVISVYDPETQKLQFPETNIDRFFQT